MTRGELDELYDELYVLEAAVEDVERDLANDDSPRAAREAIGWLLDAAKPLVRRSKAR